MAGQVISSTVRRSNRNRIVLGIVLAAIVFGVAVFNLRYLTNFVSGPRPADRNELLTMTDPNVVAHNWVEVTGDEIYDTNMQMVRSSNGGSETVESNYMALQIDDRLLLVETPNSASVKNYTGALVPISAELQREVVDYVESTEDVKGAFLPYMLDADNFRTNGYIGLGVGGLTLLASLFLLTTGLQRSSNAATHPVFKRLARHGDTTMVSSEIESEMLVPRWSHKKLSITQNWLVQANPADFNAMRLPELVWMYKQVTQRRVNGVPAGKTFAAHILDRHGQKLAVVGKNEDEIHTILESVHNAAPWAFVGYNDDLNKAWNKERASVIEAVDRRRQEGAANNA